jgi:hypothetical protein
MGEMVGGVSCMSIDICEPICGIIGAYIAVRGVEAGINAVIETVIAGIISGSR